MGHKAIATLGLLVIAGLVIAPSSAQVSPAQWIEHLAFNVEVSPLNNTTLRQAMASAVDRQAVFDAVRTTLPSGWSSPGPAGSWFPPILPQHTPDLRIHPYDPPKARELLATAGFPDGSGLPEFEILYRGDLRFRRVEAEMLTMQLAAVGIRARAVGLPTADAFFRRVGRGPSGSPGAFQMAVLAWVAGPTGDFLREMFLPGGPQNIYGYRNPDVGLLIADLQREPDQSRRLELLRQAERLILTDAPVVPLVYYRVP